MSVKVKTIFICSECGATSPKWEGRCSSCGSWASMVEEVVKKKTLKLDKIIESKIKPVNLSEIQAEDSLRINTDISELDRALGGGIMPGSLILVGGDPGIGKSTLMLQMSGRLKEHKPLYITGEESLQQIKYRAERIESIDDNLLLLAETNIENIQIAIKNSDSQIIIVDSIQSVISEELDGLPGSIIQVRECAAQLMQTAKKTGKSIFIIGHITKEGMIAGPKLLEHIVDTVLQFEGEKNYSYRILRVLKNRFGSTNEIGIFEMTSQGLIEVNNPSEIFLAQRKIDESGVCVAAAIEGTRPFLLEVQALVAPTGYGVPQRSATGFDYRRLQMILAVLEKRLGMNFRHSDIFVNLAGGVYMNDTSLDLGIAVSIVSSYKDIPVDSKSILTGEIGLTGEIRHISSIELRLGEAEKLGFERAFIPELSLKKLTRKFELEIIPVGRLSLAIDKLISKF